MSSLLKWFFIDSDAKYLFMILFFECYVAINVSSTILSDSTLATYFVEKMSFIEAVHTFDGLAIHPESTSFFIALGFALVIPKSIACYFFLKKNPYSQMSQYVITPYTETKPSRTLKFGEEPTEEEGRKLLTVERSMFNRIIWSLLSLGLAAGFIFMALNIGHTSERDLATTKAITESFIQGGFSMWLGFSVCRLLMAAGSIAVSFFIIKDYFRLFAEIVKKIYDYFK